MRYTEQSAGALRNFCATCARKSNQKNHKEKTHGCQKEEEAPDKSA